MNKALLVALIVVVAGGVVAGLSVVGGPQQARLEKLDRERVSDLRRVAAETRCEPGSFEDIDAAGCILLPDTSDLRDQETDLAYARRLRPDGLLEVCAELLANPERANRPYGQKLHIDGQTACLRYRLGPEGRWMPA